MLGGEGDGEVKRRVDLAFVLVRSRGLVNKE